MKTALTNEELPVGWHKTLDLLETYRKSYEGYVFSVTMIPYLGYAWQVSCNEWTAKGEVSSADVLGAIDMLHTFMTDR